MRIGIMSPGLGSRDAVGADATGMFESLLALGYEAYLFAPGRFEGCAHAHHPYVDARWRLDRPDDLLIYHYCTADPGGLAELAKLSCRVWIRFHNVTPSHFMAPYSHDFASGTKGGRLLLAEITEMKVERFLCVSQYNARELIDLGVDRRRIRTLPPFHRINELLTSPNEPATVSFLARNVYNILVVGRLVPNKGIHLLLMALARLRESTPVMPHVNIIGVTDERLRAYSDYVSSIITDNKLETFVTIHQSVGPEALATYYRLCDIYWTASQHEGFAVPVVEAMAFERPIVSSRAGALPETGGDVPVYADEPAQMAEVLVDLLRNDEKRLVLGVRGRRRFEANFTADRISSAFGALVLENTSHQTPEESASIAASLASSITWPRSAFFVETAQKAGVSLEFDIANVRDRRLDFIMRAIEKALTPKGSALYDYFRSHDVSNFCARLPVPKAAGFLPGPARAIWSVSAFARASFPLETKRNIAAFGRWFDRQSFASLWR